MLPVFTTSLSLAILLQCFSTAVAQDERVASGANAAALLVQEFRRDVKPFVRKHCVNCHGAEAMESGIRLDRLDGTLEDRNLKLWEHVKDQIAEGTMPPEDEEQPTAAERETVVGWIERGLHEARIRPVETNGSARRLTVSQYRNTLRDLLGLQEDLTDVLPPDAVSKDGFTNNSQSMILSPLQVEAYFDIAAKALNLTVVDEAARPSIQNFRMRLGEAINPESFPERLILGAGSRLLSNSDFVVEELSPEKPFAYDAFRMRKEYRFNEGYAGNSTVRGWRDYDSIYHAVFACVRGARGYPKGLAYETVPSGLLLRPSLPSMRGYGDVGRSGTLPNFKVSLRELPEHGNFRVTVRAAKYDDGLLADANSQTSFDENPAAFSAEDPAEAQAVEVSTPGVYQVAVHQRAADAGVTPDASHLDEGLVAAWSFDESAITGGQLTDGAKFVDSPLGKAVSFDGKSGSVVVPRDKRMNVGTGDFTVAAWIHPKKLRQGGIFCLGKYSWTHGWYFDMPDNKGVLRIETVNPDNEPNGTVTSGRGVIQEKTWQHVAAVVRRGKNETRLYVNGYEVAKGTVAAKDLDNPKVDLHIGRIQDAQVFNGSIDDVRFYRRALDVAELQALIEPARHLAKARPSEKNQQLKLSLGDRRFSGTLHQPAFLTLRLAAGPLQVQTNYGGKPGLDRIDFHLLDESSSTFAEFVAFEKRLPRVGVHLGLRRDCGSTLAQVGVPQTVTSAEARDYTFFGAINDYPSPDVQEKNDNYLAGVREIGVRSECTDARDMPRLRIESVEFEGPFFETWPPKSHRQIFVDSDHGKTSEAYASEVIRRFATRAFRRPVADDELDSFVKVWRNSFKATNDSQLSIKDSLLVILTSPQFLFLIDHSHSPQAEDVTPHELASKLSYFLWNAAPDDRLLSLAETDQLHDSLDAEVERLVADSRFEQFLQEFGSQWLSLDKADVVEIDSRKYPRLSRIVRRQLRNEPIQLLQHLIRENLPVRQLVNSDFILANEVVASYYDLSDKPDTGFEFVPVKHNDPHLGGVLSSAIVLAGLSDGRESNPVKRGAWLARKIIAEPPEDPPPNVPALDEDLTKLTLRERLERHRNQKGCVKCHEGIDPWGVPFEEFDAGGRFKTTAVDARSTLPDDTKISGLDQLKTYLADDRIDQVAFSTVKHLASYAIGRSLTYKEIEFLKEATLELKGDGYRMQDLVRFVVYSDLFLKK